MFKKSFSALLLISLLSAFILVTISTSVYAEKRGKPIGLRTSSDLSHRCVVPYNINDYGYSTGLHIIADWTADLEFEIDFFCGANYYYTKTITVPPEGATFMVQDLLPAGVSLRFPTLLFIYSHVDPDSRSEEQNFWVTQFLFTGSGFSHQTFFSYPNSDVLY